jgi:protein subunit release factor A
MVLDDFVKDKLQAITQTYQELTDRLGDPDVLSSPQSLMQVGGRAVI